MVLFPSNEFNETCVCILQYIENQFLYINNNSIGIWYSICFFPVPVILVLKELLVLANLDAS